MKYFSLLIIFLFAQSSLATCPEVQTFLKKADQLYQHKQFLLSSFHFSSASLLECNDSSLKSRAQLGYLYSLYELGEKDEGFKYLQQVDNTLPIDAQKKLDVFKAVQLGLSKDDAINKRIEAFEKWKAELPIAKSKSLAAGLSAVLPGAGQAYTGSYQSAAMAFLLNALFLSATLELQKKELRATSLASGLVFSIVYVGNILNAAHTADVYNTNLNQPLIDAKKDQLFPELKP